MEVLIEILDSCLVRDEWFKTSGKKLLASSCLAAVAIEFLSRIWLFGPYGL